VIPQALSDEACARGHDFDTDQLDSAHPTACAEPVTACVQIMCDVPAPLAGMAQHSPALIFQRALARSQTDSNTRARAIVVSSRGPGSTWMRSPAAADVAGSPRGETRQKIGPEETGEEREREKERDSFIRNNLHNGVVSGAEDGDGAADAGQSSEAPTGSDAQASALWREKFRARMRSLATGDGLRSSQQCLAPAHTAPVDRSGGGDDDHRGEGLDSSTHVSSEARAAFVAALQG